jgi:hypothetical protein
VPLRADDGRRLLNALRGKLRPPEVRLRRKCFLEAHRFIGRVSMVGGLDASYIRSFTVPGDGFGRRVDVEVRAGRAFVP